MDASSPASGGRPAVFFDRDGTLIHDAHYIARPEQVALIPGAAAAVRRLNEMGLPAIVVTNQSGIARGLLTEQQYQAVRQHLDDLLAAQGAHIDASYHCPHLPEISGPCECRKPGLKLYRQAAADHGIDFKRSFFIGDRIRDVQPATAVGGRGILVPTFETPLSDIAKGTDVAVVASTLGAAVDRVCNALRAMSS